MYVYVSLSLSLSLPLIAGDSRPYLTIRARSGVTSTNARMRDEMRTCKYSSVRVGVRWIMLVAMCEINDANIEKYDREKTKCGIYIYKTVKVAMYII